MEKGRISQEHLLRSALGTTVLWVEHGLCHPEIKSVVVTGEEPQWMGGYHGGKGRVQGAHASHPRLPSGYTSD